MTHAVPSLEREAVGGLLDLAHDAKSLLEASGLAPQDFSDLAARGAFGAIVAMVERGRTPTLESVAAVVGARIAAWVCKPALRTRETFLSDATEIRRLSKLRTLEAFHRKQLEALSAQNADPAQVALAAEAFVQTFAGTTAPDETGERDLLEIAEDWDAYTQGIRAPFVPTGIDVLDEHFGGWVCSLNVVGGLPSVGKSALVGETIMNNLRAGLRVGLFGLEDATKWLAKRHIARALGINVGAVAATKLHDHQAAALSEELNRLDKLVRGNLVVYRRPGITPQELLQRCRHWVLNLGVKCIYIDHGGEVQHQSSGPRDRHDLAVAATYRGIRDLAVTHRVPIVVLCHFNRDADGTGRPRPKSFAETAYIERMARLALGLWEREQDPDELLVEVLKATEGERDVTLAIKRDRRFALVRSHGGQRVNHEAMKPRRGRGNNWMTEVDP